VKKNVISFLNNKLKAPIDNFVPSRILRKANQVALTVLKDWTVTWGLKNTLPSAAVENIGQ